MCPFCVVQSRLLQYIYFLGGLGSTHIENCWATAVHICPVSIFI